MDTKINKLEDTMGKPYIIPGTRVLETVYHFGTVIAVDREHDTVIMQEGNTYRTVPINNLDVVDYKEVDNYEKLYS